MNQLQAFRLINGDSIDRVIVVEKSSRHSPEERRHVRIERWIGKAAVVKVLREDDKEIINPYQALLTPTTVVYGYV